MFYMAAISVEDYFTLKQHCSISKQSKQNIKANSTHLQCVPFVFFMAVNSVYENTHGL